VWDGDKIRAVKNFVSLNIRIPHQVFDCSKMGYQYIFDRERNAFNNTLIISPPGAGKTTFLRDITRLLSHQRPIINVLLVDERSEIAAVHNSTPQLDVGQNTDIISNSSKAFAFEQGIRAMRPDVIVVDELAGGEDIEAINYALSAGVAVIASIHAKNIYDLCNKKNFDIIVTKKLFDLFMVLSNLHGPGTVQGIFDSDFKEIAI
jgi:stage III sporulation protein AA